MSNSIRISADLFERATAHGAVLSRSAAQQVEHWARLGAALEAHGLSVVDMAQLLQVLRETEPASGAVSEGALWAFKRERQASDMKRMRSGEAMQQQMSWFSKGKAKSAKLANSPF